MEARRIAAASKSVRGIPIAARERYAGQLFWGRRGRSPPHQRRWRKNLADRHLGRRIPGPGHTSGGVQSLDHRAFVHQHCGRLGDRRRIRAARAAIHGRAGDRFGDGGGWPGSLFCHPWRSPHRRGDARNPAQTICEAPNCNSPGTGAGFTGSGSTRTAVCRCYGWFLGAPSATRRQLQLDGPGGRIGDRPVHLWVCCMERRLGQDDLL